MDMIRDCAYAYVLVFMAFTGSKSRQVGKSLRAHIELETMEIVVRPPFRKLFKLTT